MNSILTRSLLYLSLCLIITGCAAMGAAPYQGSPTLSPTSFAAPDYAVPGGEYYAPNVDYYSPSRNEAAMNEMSHEAIASGGFHGGGGRR